uniref:Putative portal protein n=1 Tax=viral metagenome TaxID=1070528 RepID=A0A6H1ZM60_9ZZZZ
MSWFYKQYAKFFPERALKSFIASRRIARLTELQEKRDNFIDGFRSFESVAKGRGRFDLTSDSRNMDASIADSGESLRNHVRQLEQNNGHVSGPIRRIVNNYIGQGIRFQSAVMADASGKKAGFPKINESMADLAVYFFEKHFAAWNKQADVRLLQSFYEQQKTIGGALERDGESLVIGRISNRRGRIIPYCLEVLEIDRLQTPPGEITNPKIRRGIEYDDEGVPKTYFILKAHPGERITFAVDNWEFDAVPAYFDTPGEGKLQKVFHLFNPFRRPEQTRGFSEFAPGLKDLHDLDRYMEAEKLAALEDACMTGIVKTTDPTGFANNYTDASGGEGYERIHEFAPNKVHYLRANEEFDIHGPTRPNTAFAEVINQWLRGPANALDIPPEVFTQNWQGLNYSNARTILLNFYMALNARTAYLRDHLCIPVWENVGTWLVIKGLVPALGFDRRRDDYLSSTWIPAVYRKWVDPTKEAQGKQIDMENLIENLGDVLAERGIDFDTHIEKRAREVKKIQEVEKKHGVKLTKTVEKPAEVTPNKDEIEVEDENGKRSFLSVV